MCVYAGVGGQRVLVRAVGRRGRSVEPPHVLRCVWVVSRTCVPDARVVEFGAGRPVAAGDGEAILDGSIWSEQFTREHPGEACTVVGSKFATTRHTTWRFSR
jgi:hypothetical protein